MTLSIHIPPEIEQRLLDEALRQGVDPADYAGRLIREHLPSTSNAQTAMEFDRVLDEFFASNSERLPSLPPDFSRQDLYLDHD
jgi:hypothetical protein